MLGSDCRIKAFDSVHALIITSHPLFSGFGSNGGNLTVG